MSQGNMTTKELYEILVDMRRRRSALPAFCQPPDKAAFKTFRDYYESLGVLDQIAWKRRIKTHQLHQERMIGLLEEVIYEKLRQERPH